MSFASGSSTSCLLDFIPVGEGGGDGEMKDEQYEQSAAGGWQYWANPEARVISAKGKSVTEDSECQVAEYPGDNQQVIEHVKT